MMIRFLFLGLIGAVGGALAGCAGRDHYFQPDARIAPAASGAPDSARVTVGRHYADHGAVYRAFFGDHYRAVWATSVTLPVLALGRLPGTPKPTELGGGFQTTSITLETPARNKMVARTLDKDPYKTLPKYARKTFLLRLVRDETSAANPFAPLVLPTLSQAAGIPYTTPRLYYVGSLDSTFDALTPKLRGKVVLVEEKFDGKPMATATRVPGAEDVVDSEDALRARYHSPDEHLDALAFARARLFDIWIGDWDRHEGQWDWAEVPTDGKGHRYVPVPKDRDQAFFRFDDGFLPWLASRRWAVRKLRTTHAHFDDVRGLVLNARFIDRRVLAAVTAAQLDSLALDLQARLTDSVIARAFRAWPAPIRAAEAERTAAMLRSRRAELPVAARTFYESLAEEPLVAGTDADERIVVTRLPGNSVRVSLAVADDPDSPAPLPYYTRIFTPTETTRLRVYGLGGNDEFILLDSTAANAARVRIHLYGGEGEDKLKVPGMAAPSVRFYDTKRGIQLPEDRVRGLKVKLAKRGDVRIHAFDREGL